MEIYWLPIEWKTAYFQKASGTGLKKEKSTSFSNAGTQDSKLDFYVVNLVLGVMLSDSLLPLCRGPIPGSHSR